MPKKYTLKELREIAIKRNLNSSNLNERQLCHALGINCVLVDFDEDNKEMLKKIQELPKYKKRREEMIENDNQLDVTNIVMR